MMTPQEVASHAFAKATFGGYSMAMVDEFLDALTEDYTALYNDNAILKNKLKVLSDTVEEYRATDNAMRKTLLAAQQMAEAMVSEAEAKKAELVSSAEVTAKERLASIRQQVLDEECRLKAAREATAAYVAKVTAANAGLQELLAGLNELTAEPAEPEQPAEPVRTPIIDLFASIPVVEEPVEEEAPEEAPEDTAPDFDEIDPDATRRFEDLQFGRDYEIR